MQHNISITVINNTVGEAQSTDGIMGLFIKAVAVSTTFVLNTAYLISKLSDLEALGVDAAYDTSNGVAVYQQVSEFYNQAGSGTLLWVFPVAKNTAYATFVANSVFDGLIRGTAAATPANRVKMIGLCYDVPTTTQSATNFPADVLAAIPALETKRLSLFAEGYQFSGIVDGYRMSSTITPTTIGTVETLSASGVSLCITSTKGNGVSQVGAALGRFARISIGHGFGAVEDGPIAAATAFLTNSVLLTTSGTLIVGNVYTVYGGAITYNSVVYQPSTDNKLVQFTAATGFTSFTTSAGGYVIDNATPIQLLTPSDIDQLGSKQFMFVRKWFGLSGFFWNDGATCELATKSLSTQEYNRVANALSADALSFFVTQMGKNLPLDAATGSVDQGYLNAKQAEFKTQYIDPISVNSGTGDITTASLTLAGPNFNSTKTMTFKLQIVPTPILGGVTGTVEFVASL